MTGTQENNLPYEPHWPWTVEEYLQNLWGVADEVLAGTRPEINLAARVHYNIKHLREAYTLEINAAILRGLEAALALRAANEALGPTRTPYEPIKIKEEAQGLLELLLAGDKARADKVDCPTCDGTGHDPRLITSSGCGTCRGAKKVTRNKAYEVIHQVHEGQ